MNAALESFIADMRADARMSEFADRFMKEFREVEAESICNWHALRFLKAVTWIVSQPRTLDEKLEALGKLLSLPKCHVLIPSMRRLTGWDT